MNYIGDSAFSGCKSLESVNIPDGVEEIEEYTFCGCESLTSVVIPDSVTALHKGAFSGCANITEIIYKGRKYGRNDMIELYKDINGDEWLSNILDKA